MLSLPMLSKLFPQKDLIKQCLQTKISLIKTKKSPFYLYITIENEEILRNETENISDFILALTSTYIQRSKAMIHEKMLSGTDSISALYLLYRYMPSKAHIYFKINKKIYDLDEFLDQKARI